MKKQIYLTFAVFLAAMPFASRADIFFNDTFGSGSTLTNATPANPTVNSTAYQLLSARTWAGQSLTANDLRIGMVATSSGILEVQALFSTNPITLTAGGDYIQMTVTFTNTAGLLTAANGTLDFGLFNSGGLNGSVKPVTNGLNGTLVGTSTTAVTGAAQNWLGYLGQILFNGGNSRIMNRSAQTGANNQNQGTVGSGTSSGPANPAPATVGSTVVSTTTLTVGATYTDVLYITRDGSGNLAVTNTFYAGPDTTGSVLANFGGITTGSTYLTSGFDSLSIGYRCAVATTMDISSIKVEGSVTPVSTPPTITTQPVSVNVATNGSCPFVVSATGVNLTYQWRRNGTNLLNGGNISGVASSNLVIINASVEDVASGANGYYCVVTGAGNLSTNSTTNSLTLVPAKNLVWNGAGADWDLNASPNWNGPGATTFNYGDSVTFDDAGAANANVNLNGNFLSASKWLIGGNTAYAFSGSGIFAGNGSLIFNSAASGNMQLTLNNTYTGATIISNSNPALTVYIGKYQTLGSSTSLTLAQPGIMEFAVSGSATLGVPGDVIVNDDFTFQFDGSGVFAGVVFGNLSGASGKTLTLTPQSTASSSRYRVYGTNMVYNGNLVLNGASTSQAAYGGTVLAPYNTAGSQTYNGVISGNGGLIERGSSGVTILNGQNTYVGGTFAAAGSIAFGVNSTPTSGTVTSGPIGTGPLFVAPELGSANGTGTILASGGARTVANPIQYPSSTNNQTLAIGGTNNLTLSGNISLQGQDASSIPVTRNFQINNTGATTLSGVIDDGGLVIGIAKSGTNNLYLNGINTYTGPTTNSAGLLAGSGTIAGSVFVQTNASIGGGSAAAIGTLNINGDLYLAPGARGFFRVNRSGSSSDQVSVTGVLTNMSTGTITVTNLGATLQVNDTFFLFNKGLSNGAALTITGGGMNWTNKLAVDGSIQALSVVSTVNTNAFKLTNSVSGNVLTLAWPADHTGYRLQVQTNSLSAGLFTNWVTIPGSTNVNSTNFTINPANGAVFYRLIYP